MPISAKLQLFRKDRFDVGAFNMLRLIRLWLYANARNSLDPAPSAICISAKTFLFAAPRTLLRH
jgi:hypothetical protein